LRIFVAVENSVGKFSVEKAFRITGRGWALVGELEGSVLPGYHLDFGSGIILHVRWVELTRSYNIEKFGLIVSNQFQSRQELIDQKIIGSTAQILE